MQPTNLQMYSRIGKSSDEKFIMIKHQMEIISGKSQKFVPSSPMSFKDKLIRRAESLKGVEEVLQELDRSNQNRNTTQKPKKKPTSAFKSQSRDAWYKATTHREIVPPCGYYTVSYSLLEKNKLTPNLAKFQAHKFKVTPASEIHDPVDKPVIKPLDPVKFSLQIGRYHKHKKSTKDEEEVSSLTPEKSVSTPTLRKIRTPDLSKTLGRTQGLFDKVCSTPSYSPRFEIVTQDQSKSHVIFNKQSPRPTMELLNLHDLIPRKLDFKQIEKRVSVPDLGKVPSRPSNKYLPSFMLVIYIQKNSSRFGLNLISDKALEMNNFAKAEFMTVVSSFTNSLASPKSSHRMKSDTFNDPRRPSTRQV